MTARELKHEAHKAINIAIADGKRQEREALKAKEYVRVVTTRSYISGLEVARTILLTVNDDGGEREKPRVRVNQRTDKEIDALFDECVDGQQDRFFAKTYEAGIAACLLWLFEGAKNPLEIDGYLSDFTEGGVEAPECNHVWKGSKDSTSAVIYCGRCGIAKPKGELTPLAPSNQSEGN